MPDQDWGSIIDEEAQKVGLRPELARAVARVESGKLGQKAVSNKGAVGIMQLMPNTASMYKGDINNPLDNIRMGIQHLKMLHTKYKGDEKLTLAAYNAGEGAVARAGGIPNYPETRGYVHKALGMAGEDVTPQGWQSQATKSTVKGQAVHGEDVTPQNWLMTPPPGMPQKPTLPGQPVRFPSMDEQAEALKRQAPGGFLADVTKSFLAPSNLGTIAGATAGGMVMGVPGAMVGGGLGSAAGQYLESGGVDPVQLGLDVALAPTGGAVTEATGARQIAKGTRRGLTGEAEAAAKGTVAREPGLMAQRQGAEQGLTASKVVGTPAEVGGRTQEDILTRYRGERAANTANYDAFMKQYGDLKVGQLGPSGVDTRPTFKQLHARQSAYGDRAAEAFQQQDYKTWKEMKTRKERVLDKMEQELAPSEAQQFRQLRADWNIMEEKVRQPAVQKLMRKSHDDVSRVLEAPGTLTGPRGKGRTLGGGTPSPSENIEALRDVMSPQQFDEFKNSVRDRLVDSARGKAGDLDPVAFENRIKKMGGHFPALFEAAEQKEMTDAAALMKRMDAELGGVEKAKIQLKSGDYGIPQVPDIPEKNVRSLTGGVRNALLAGSAPYMMPAVGLGHPAMMSTAAAAMGVYSIIKNAPPILKGLMKSPEARQLLAKAAKSSFSDPIWDDLVRGIMTGAFSTGQRYLMAGDSIPTPPAK